MRFEEKKDAGLFDWKKYRDLGIETGAGQISYYSAMKTVGIRQRHK
jgi:DUF971 family protein